MSREMQLTSLAKSATEKGVTIGVAESLTAGLIGSTLAGVSGASNWFRGGVIVYSCELKNTLLGVNKELLETKGPVCAEVAAQMAAGAKTLLGCELTLSITGLAGPIGDGISAYPVGTVFIGWQSEWSSGTKEYHFSGTRNEVREQACGAAIELLAENI